MNQEHKAVRSQSRRNVDKMVLIRDQHAKADERKPRRKRRFKPNRARLAKVKRAHHDVKYDVQRRGLIKREVKGGEAREQKAAKARNCRLFPRHLQRKSDKK